MEHYFDLPVIYKGEELNLKGRLVTFGYVYKFYVIINDREVVFEKDEEEKYRVYAKEEKDERVVDPALLEVIIKALNSLPD